MSVHGPRPRGRRRSGSAAPTLPTLAPVLPELLWRHECRARDVARSLEPRAAERSGFGQPQCRERRARRAGRRPRPANAAKPGTEGGARADLGGTPLSKWFLDYGGPADGIAVEAGAGASISATELVLAIIDVTGSMLDNLDGARVASSDPSSRINLVRTAARDLVDLLASRENSTIAVGLVPWSYRVRLGHEPETELARGANMGTRHRRWRRGSPPPHAGFPSSRTGASCQTGQGAPEKSRAAVASWRRESEGLRVKLEGWRAELEELREAIRIAAEAFGRGR